MWTVITGVAISVQQFVELQCTSKTIKREDNSEGWTEEAAQQSFPYFKVFDYFSGQYED